ncbi:MAG: CRTAC1 family protein [Gammaproteobacteria bacterium WSBS_2016_MAG_OTU1]
MKMVIKQRTQWAIIIALGLFATSCSFENVRNLPADTKITSFEEVAIEASGNEWSEQFHPVVGAAPIDIDGDGTMEVFIGGGNGHDDMLFSYQNNRFVNIIGPTGLSDTIATHGAASMDMDGDGDTDLLITRNNGIFLYINNNGIFSRMEIAADLPANSTPFNVAVGDIDRDGDGDLYISTFVDIASFRSATYNDPTHAKTNVLLRNDGDLTFTDITDQAGVASLQNTFLASFVDLNGDGWQDLIVAQNTGQVEIFRNMQDNSFAAQDVKTGWGFWMGLATGDIDRDGDQDLFFTNSGNSVPAALLELAGDATDEQPRNYGWILLRNDGDFKLSDITAEYQLDDYGFAWGAVFEDLTLDGELELLVAQNYIKWPVHRYTKLSGKSFVLADDAYYQAAGLGLEHYDFAQSPLIVDFNNDGKPDVFWINMDGSKQIARAFLNRTDNNFMTLLFADNMESLGARVFIETAEGKSYTREIHNNIGLSTDQSTSLTFGLGQKTDVLRAVIQWADGSRQILDNPPINKVINITR